MEIISKMELNKFQNITDQPITWEKVANTPKALRNV